MKKILATIVAGLLIFTTLTACNKSKSTSSTDSTTEGTTSTSSTTEAAIQTQNKNYDLNPLTGAYDIKKGEDTRPVAFMISNISLNKKQPGIHNADMYFDMETEGGISRLMVVFAGIDRVPDKIGPVRSARSPFIKCADALSAVYVHYGGQQYIRKRIEGTSISDVDGIYNAGNYFSRDSAFKAPNNAVTGKEKIQNFCNAKKYSTKSPASAPLEFLDSDGSFLGTQSGISLQVNISSNSRASFKYNAEGKKYTKYLGPLTDNTVHKSYEGVDVEAKSVVVIYAKRYNEGSKNEHTNFELQSGTGLVLCEGKSVKMDWELTSSGFKFSDSSGAKILLPAGNTYFCITATTLQSKTILN